MKVTLKGDWFAPSSSRMGTDKIFTMSGQRFQMGTHTMPDELRPFLPKSAVVHDGEDGAEPVEPEAPQEENLLRAFDAERAAGDAEGEARSKADKFKEELETEHAAKRKQMMRERMAAVRAAKLSKAS